MSDLVLVLGTSGSGKSTSLQHLDPKTTVLFNTIRKRLPFAGAVANYGNRLITPDLSDPYKLTQKISKVFEVAKKAPHVKAVVIEDYQYIMSLAYAKGKKGGEGWETFDRIFQHATDLFTEAISMREDLTVFILSHTEEKETGIGEKTVQMKTVGKAFREKMTPEGFATVLLLTDPDFDDPDNPVYRFRTNGQNPSKSPQGMFPQHIPNDLDFVLRRMAEFYDKGTGYTESEVVKSAFEKAKMALGEKPLDL